MKFLFVLTQLEAVYAVCEYSMKQNALC